MPKFFCFSPTDWFEATDHGHVFSLAFERPLSDEELLELAALVDQTGSGQIADVFGPWLWSGRILQFRASGWGVTHLPKVRSWALRIHERFPIVDVVFHGLREGDSGEGEPVAAPESDEMEGYRPIDVSLPGFAERPCFDEPLLRLAGERWAKRRNAEHAAKLDKALSKQKPDAAVRFEPFEGELVESGDEAEELEFDGVPNMSGEPAKLARPVVGERAIVVAGLAALYVDGRTVVTAGLAALRVDFSSREVEWLPRPGFPDLLLSGAPLADGCHAQLTSTTLYVLDRDHTVVAAEKAGKPGRIFAIAGGHGLCLLNDKITIYTWAHGKLRKLASLALRARAVVERPDALLFTTDAGNLRAIGALEAIAAAVEAKPRASKPKRFDVPLVRWTVLSEAPPRPSTPAAKLPEGLAADRTAASPNGEWVALQDARTLSVLEVGSGRISPALPSCEFFFMRDDGILVAHGFGQVWWRTRGPAGAPEWPGVRMTVEQAERAEYLPGHDLLLLFDKRGMRAYTFAGELDPTELRGKGEVGLLGQYSVRVDEAYEHEDGVVLRGPWGCIRADGLR